MKDRNLKRMVGEFSMLCGKDIRVRQIMAGFGFAAVVPVKNVR